MEIFISWSGERSKKFAEVLRDWLPKVIQTVRPWCSESDLDKGARWLREISEKLEKTDFGLICLMSENLNEPWILFEAGALSKSLGSSKVCPILFDFEPSDLKGPLSQFQATRIKKDEMLKLIQTINKALPNNTLSEKQLEETFELWWPQFEKKMKEIPEPTATKTKSRRADRDILEEVLKIVRNLERERLSPLEKILESLSPREEKIIRMKYGLGEERQYSYEEIGKVLGLPIDQVEAIEKSALRRLRHSPSNLDWYTNLQLNFMGLPSLVWVSFGIWEERSQHLEAEILFIPDAVSPSLNDPYLVV